MKNKIIKSSISLGEGNTPLIRLYNLEKQFKWQGELWAKAEYQNPTGSFKDRGSIAEVSAALKLNKKGVVCASTGNMAASLAAYATRAKLACQIIVPANTPKTKLKQSLAFGAELVKVQGNYDNCVGKAKQTAKEKNYLLCGDYKVRRRGQSTLGIELAKSRVLFNAFIAPVGNGTIACATAEGLASYGQFPQFIGVQAKGSNPVFKAWKKKTRKIKSIKNPQTIASAIKVGQPLDGQRTLNWVKKTNGLMISVSNKEILKAKKLLSQKEGIFVETSAATTLAGFIKTIKKLAKNSKIVLILTGNGLKENNIN